MIRCTESVTIPVLRNDAEIEVDVPCRLVDDSFDHEFGVERAWSIELGDATRADTGDRIQLTAAEERQADEQARAHYFD